MTPFSTFTNLLSRAMRVVVMDKRGTGLSDPVVRGRADQGLRTEVMLTARRP
jgi:hypothetical protein